jgi:hypothetical protein
VKPPFLFAGAYMPTTFYNRPVLDPVQTRETGRPIYTNKEYIKIVYPGDRMTVVDKPVKPHHIEKYPLEYARFKQIGEKAKDGTPLEECTFLAASQAETLKYNNISTLEDLVQAPDHLLSALGAGFSMLRSTAEAYLVQAADAASKVNMQEAAEKLAKQDAEIEALKRQVAELTAVKGKSKPVKDED